MSIQVAGLEKRFGKDLVVHGVSFEAPDGQLTTLLGPSGSGKSTILRMIAGLERPDAGEIRIGGQDATRKPVQKRNVGFVFQNFALFRHLSVRDNVAFGLSVQRQPRAAIEARVRELLTLIQMEEFASVRPGQLSGGQRQRVALARALAPRPQVLLLDEPFGALDAKLRQELRAWLHELHQKVPVTTLMVTHDQEEAMELSDRVVVIRAGRVEQIGAPVEIYDRPATPFVASFVGAANVLDGRVEHGQAALGTLKVAAPGAAAEGQPVRAFVRPHDVVVAPAATAAVAAPAGEAVPESMPEVASARVHRLVRVGWTVKVHVVLSDGQPLVVQMTKDQVEAMRIQDGDRVLVNLKEAKIFVQDYAI
ncbi:MAG TPA: ABC transporter ATP-binding protein [Polyangia bacterium]|nr:ABC transporter ATP-binding protein [Polyangia bacterium]